VPPSRDRRGSVLGKLGGDELEVAFYEHEVGSRLIGLPQRQDVIFRHIHVMPEDGCVNHAVRWLSYSRNSRLVRPQESGI